MRPKGVDMKIYFAGEIYKKQKYNNNFYNNLVKNARENKPLPDGYFTCKVASLADYEKHKKLAKNKFIAIKNKINSMDLKIYSEDNEGQCWPIYISVSSGPYSFDYELE